IKAGSTNNPLNLRTASVPMVWLNTTCALIAGKSVSMQIDHVMTIAASAGHVEALRVSVSSDVKTGAWCNAIIARLDYKTSGAAHGEAGPLYAELTLPNSSLSRGELYGLGIGISAGASSSWASAGPVSFIKFDAQGTLTNLNASGYLFHLAGITDTANGLFDLITAAGFDACLKIRVGSTDYFIGLANDNSFA
ncbi:hypothetical protein LCGC14_3007180, partial [marine sediment metagenome]